MAKLLELKRFGWGLVFLLLTAVALLSYFSGVRYLAAARAVEHTLAVEAAVNGTLSLLKDAETGQRGYLLTADAHFLDPYETARREIPLLFGRLANSTRDDAVQSEHVAKVRALIDEKLAFIERNIGFGRAGDQERALREVRAGHGKRIMDRLRAECRVMLDHEERLLELRKHEAHAAQQTAIWAVGVGTLVTILLALLSFLTVNGDIDELKRAAEELAASEEHYRLLTEQGSDLVRLLSPTGAVTYVSPSVERILGYSVEEYMALPPRSLMHPDELEQAAKLLADIASGAQREGIANYQLRHKSGEYRWFEVRWAARYDVHGKLLDVHSAGRDVTERLAAARKLSAYAEQLRSLSLRDELTGLYNRRGFLEVAGQAYNQALRDARPAALIFVDLNGMKRINDEQGHDVGDLALKDTAHILTGALRHADVVARLGGDEFVGFALDFMAADVDALRARLRAQADARVAEQARSFRLSMSVGAAYLRADAQTGLAELLEQADAAMYEQKNARRLAGGMSVRPPSAVGS